MTSSTAGSRPVVIDANLALAEERGAELWTGDGRLVRRARQLDADWVHQLEV